MITQSTPLQSCGHEIPSDPSLLGPLRSSTEIQNDSEALRQRMQEDGYLYLPGFFNRELIENARRTVVDRLAQQGVLDPDRNPMDGVLRAGANPRFKPDLAENNPALDRAIYGPEILDFYKRLLGGTIRHFDYTWFRAMGPGHGTKPHCDVVYMGRGTRQLYTAWVPLGDVTFQIGGLMVLEGSHHQKSRFQHYLDRDVDTYCSNGPFAESIESGNRLWEWDGSLSNNPVSLQQKLGGRWLTAEFRMGDLLTFGMETVHASIDNHSDRIRLSTDSRYQLASEPIDERWIGDSPIGHSLAGKRGRIC